MPELELPRAWLEEVRRQLAAHVPAAEVWAYGSRVSGGCQEASDLDLVLRNPQDLSQPVAGASDLREAFREGNLPIVVETHDWAYLPSSFRDEIERQFVVLQP